MVFLDINTTESESNTSFSETDEKKSDQSESSVCKPFDEQIDDAVLCSTFCRKSTSLPCKRILASDSKKSDSEDSGDDSIPILKTVEQKQSLEKLSSENLESRMENIKTEHEENRSGVENTSTEEPPTKSALVDTQNHAVDTQKKKTDTAEISETLPGMTAEKTGSNTSKIGKLRINSQHKRPSEIPKLKSLSKAVRGIQQKSSNSFPSKLPVKKPAVYLEKTEKEAGRKHNENTTDISKSNSDSLKIIPKPFRGKNESKENENIKQALAEDFGYLVPLYEREFQKVSEVWVNTVYCSLTMRTNLVKLLFQAFPNINREQFHTEDERLLHCIAHAKISNKSEADHLIKFIKALIAKRDKTKEDYVIMMENKEIAESHNHDWKKLLKKMTDLREETHKIQTETPELEKKKETYESNLNEKILRMEANLSKKEDEIKKLVHQLNILKQKESAYKENTLLKIPDYKEIKEDVHTLITTQKEFDELKAKYLYQNFTFEKIIKDLEQLLEEKKKILEKERGMKKQLQSLQHQFQTQQKRLPSTVGNEHIEYVLGRSFQDRNKRREQLWIAAVKLVLRGFIIQMNKLERDRNKMLFELHSNDLDNFSYFTTIIQKDNFIKSIQQQMNDLQKRCTYSRVKSSKG